MEKISFSGYKFLWLIVFFDLPVVEDEDRKAATKFRADLMDIGFCMAQFSVYMKSLSGKESETRVQKYIKSTLPKKGSIYVLTITDRQYENIKVYHGKDPKSLKNPEQLVLF